MSPAADCPPVERWEALLADTLSPDEQEQWARHLESCVRCQVRLDRAEKADPLLRLAREVGDPTLAPADPTESRFLERLYGAPASPLTPSLAEPPDLYFLRPADRPGVLGVLGEYEVEEVIGQGGMGVVLKAYEPALHRLVAIKVLAPALAGSATARRRFTREAQAAAAVCHENVVAVHGVHEATGLPYLVMQYVQGESLQTRLDRAGPLDLMEVVCIGLQTAAGLAAAHAQGLIHRDIKPANLLLENGLARVKITDFGLARMADDVQLTQQGVVAGTPEYMAPEQARGEPVDHRADLFSLGSVLYAMGTGVPPFGGSTAVAVLRQVSDQEPAPPRALHPEVPAWLESVILRLLAKDPTARFQSAAEVAALLEGYLAHLRQPATVPAPELPPWTASARPEDVPERRPEVSRPKGRALPWFRRPAGLLTAAVVLLTVVGLGAARWLAGGPAGERGPGGISPRSTGGKEARQAEFHQDFRFIDPHSEALRPIGQGGKTDDKGVRITLPAGQGRAPYSGFQTGFSLRGDFEVTTAFEILQVDRPPGGFGVGVSIYAAIDPKTNDGASLARRVLPDGKALFVSDRLKPVAGKLTHQGKTLPSTSASGRLRLQRVGSRVRYLVSDGPDAAFVQVDEADVGTTDLHPVLVGGDAGRSESGLDFRLLSFSVRADDLPGAPANAGVSSTQSVSSDAAGEDAGRKGWLAALVILGLVTVGSFFLGVWLYVRHDHRRATAGKGVEEAVHPRPAPPPPSIAVQCASCGKRLNVKAELAGKKGKCPQCGGRVQVPEIGPGVAPRVEERRVVSPAKKGWRWAVLALALLALLGGSLALRHRAKRTTSLVNVTVGHEYVAGVEESGFHGQQFGTNGQPFRWTDGNARLEIPIDRANPPQALRVQLWPYRPANARHATVRILVNQHELFRQTLSPDRWEKTFDLGGIDLGDRVVVEILSDTFVPAEIKGAGEDGRTLGVDVRGVTLLGPPDEVTR